jgi:hypothetical protein
LVFVESDLDSGPPGYVGVDQAESYPRFQVHQQAQHAQNTGCAGAEGATHAANAGPLQAWVASVGCVDGPRQRRDWRALLRWWRMCTVGNRCAACCYTVTYMYLCEECVLEQFGTTTSWIGWPD